MTYNEFIQNIIDTRGQWNLEVKNSGICERHHILPRCRGGLPKRQTWNEHHNLIWLYPQEHFMAHRLLYEELSDNNYGIIIAYYRMSKQKKYAANLSVEELQKLKADNSRAISEMNKKKIICLETKQVFNSVREAANYIKNITGKDRYNKIYDALNLGDTWFGLHWDYFDEAKYPDWIKYDNFNGNIPLKLYQRHKHTDQTKLKLKSAWNTRHIKYKESDLLAHEKSGESNRKRHKELGFSDAELLGFKKTSELRKKKVICLETNNIFDSIKDAQQYMFNLNGLKNGGGIHSALKDQTKFWNGFHWMYLDDYNNKTQDEIHKIISQKYTGQKIKILCIETNESFESAGDASRRFGTSKQAILAAINRNGTCCGYHFSKL